MPTYKNFAGQDIFVSDADAARFLAVNGQQDAYRIGEAFTPSYGSGAPGALTAPNVHSDLSRGDIITVHATPLEEARVFLARNGIEDAGRLPEAIGVSPAAADQLLQQLGLGAGVSHADVIDAGLGAALVSIPTTTARTATLARSTSTTRGPIVRPIATSPLTGWTPTQLAIAALLAYGLFVWWK